MPNMFLIGGAVKVGSSKIGKYIIGAILGFFAIILLTIICVFSSLISIFTGEKLSSDFDVKETKIYADIREIYDEYCENTKSEMQELYDQYREMHMGYYYGDVYNPDTDEYERKKIWYCNAEIKKEFSYMPTAYVLAYLSVTHQKDYLSDKNNIRINKEEVINFWNTVSGIQVDSDMDPHPQYYIHNPMMTPESIAKLYFVSEKMQQTYLESVYLISQLIGTETFDEIIYVDSPNKMGIPLYYQYASPWGSKKYGNGTIAKNGCAPTCIAMVFSYLRGYEITPADVVDFTGNRYYVNGSGSSWSIFSNCAQHWNVECNEIGTSSGNIVRALESGKPVILSMGPGTFTSSGHFIILTGIDEDGMVTVNDPNDNAKKKHAQKKFALAQILREAKGGWEFGR